MSPELKTPVLCKAIMLSGTCDLSAKAVCLNMISHNGFYGCPYFFQPGETHFTNTDGRGHVHVYPIKKWQVCHSNMGEACLWWNHFEGEW